jgi:hypothetical protein
VFRGAARDKAANCEVDGFPLFLKVSSYLHILFIARISGQDGGLTSAGIPHKSSEDDIYDGMFIPKGKPYAPPHFIS